MRRWDRWPGAKHLSIGLCLTIDRVLSVLAALLVLLAACNTAPARAPAADASAAGGPGAGASSATAGALLAAPTRVAFGHSALSAMWAPLWLAADAGLFAEQGIEPTITNIGSGPVSLAALASGDIQVGYAAGSSIVGGIVSGADLAIVGGYLDRMAYEVVARPEIATLRDLRGQTVGVNRIAGSTGFIVRYLLEREGLQIDRDVQLLQVGAQGERIAALRGGLFAATIVTPPFRTFADAAGLHVLYDTAQLPVAYSMSVIAAPRGFIAGQPGALRGVLAANRAALKRFREDGALAQRVLGTHLQVDDPALLQATWEYWRQTFADDFDSAGLELPLREVLEDNPGATRLTVDDLIDLRPLHSLP